MKKEKTICFKPWLVHYDYVSAFICDIHKSVFISLQKGLSNHYASVIIHAH